MKTIRPTFLTVLCILTFLYSGYTVVTSIQSYMTADVVSGVTSEVIDEAFDEIENSGEEVPGFVEKMMGEVSEGLSPEKIRNSAMAGGIASVLTLMGAILMWSLNKNGYWIYIAGTAVSIFAPLVIQDGVLGIVGAGGAGFFGILFVVLYGVNLKHMK